MALFKFTTLQANWQTWAAAASVFHHCTDHCTVDGQMLVSKKKEREREEGRAKTRTIGLVIAVMTIKSLSKVIITDDAVTCLQYQRSMLSLTFYPSLTTVCHSPLTRTHLNTHEHTLYIGKRRPRRRRWCVYVCVWINE